MTTAEIKIVAADFRELVAFARPNLLYSVVAAYIQECFDELARVLSIAIEIRRI